MREIKFRGKDYNTGEWRYGDLNDWSYQPKIVDAKEGKTWEVIPETVGRWLELQDANGTDIYEGDIIQFVRPLWDYDPTAPTRVMRESLTGKTLLDILRMADAIKDGVVVSNVIEETL